MSLGHLSVYAGQRKPVQTRDLQPWCNDVRQGGGWGGEGCGRKFSTDGDKITIGRQVAHLKR